MDEEDCIHGLTKQTCTICNGRDKREAKQAESNWIAITAKFDSSCVICDFPVEEGWQIFWNPSTSKVKHLTC